MAEDLGDDWWEQSAPKKESPIQDEGVADLESETSDSKKKVNY